MSLNLRSNKLKGNNPMQRWWIILAFQTAWLTLSNYCTPHKCIVWSEHHAGCLNCPASFQVSFSGYFAAPLIALHQRTTAYRHKLAYPLLFSVWLCAWCICFSSVICVLQVQKKGKYIICLVYFFNFAEVISICSTLLHWPSVPTSSLTKTHGSSWPSSIFCLSISVHGLTTCGTAAWGHGWLSLQSAAM